MYGSKIHNPIQAAGVVVAGAAAAAALAFGSGRAMASEANCTEGCNNGNGTPNTTTVTETNETLESTSGATAGAAANQAQSQTTYNINNPGGGGNGGKQVQNATQGTPPTINPSTTPVLRYLFETNHCGQGTRSDVQIGTMQSRNGNFTLNVPGLFGVSGGSAQESMSLSREDANALTRQSFAVHFAIIQQAMDPNYTAALLAACGQQTPPTPPVPVVPPQTNVPPIAPAPPTPPAELQGALPTEQVYAALQGFGRS